MNLVKIVVGLILAINFTQVWAEEAQTPTNTDATVQQENVTDIDAAPVDLDLGDFDQAETQ